MTMTHTASMSSIATAFALLCACSHGGSEHAQAAASQGAEATPPEPGTTEQPDALTDRQILTLLQTIDIGEMSTLNSPATTAFDATYMKGQVKQHRAALELIKNQLLPAAQNGDLTSQLRAASDMVQKHLDRARPIADSFGSP